MSTIGEEVPGIALSKVGMPWRKQINPHAETYFQQGEETGRRLGVIQEEKDAVRARAFMRVDPFVYPTASLERLAAAGAYNQWMFYLDDQYDDHSEVGHDLPRVESVMKRALEVLRSGTLPPNPTALEVFTQDVHHKLAAQAKPGWMERFVDHTRQYLFEGSLRSMAFWAEGGKVSVNDYMRMREWDSGVYSCLDCSLLAQNAELPASVLDHPLVQKLTRLTVRHVAFLNDLASYQKEVIRDGYTSNLVYVLSQERQLDLPGAADAVMEILNRDLTQFLETEKTLPTWGEAVDREVQKYLMGMKSWMRGNYDFALHSRRYRAPDSPFLELRKRTVSVEILTSQEPNFLLPLQQG